MRDECPTVDGSNHHAIKDDPGADTDAVLGLIASPALAQQVTVRDTNLFTCSALTVTVSGTFPGWDKANLVDGSNKQGVCIQ